MDTAAPWCIFAPDLLEKLPASPLPTVNGSETHLLVRGTIYTGRLVRLDITLMAVQGANLTIDATVFVPALMPGAPWHLPNFVGLDGFLSRLRVALDPTENAFYFGPV